MQKYMLENIWDKIIKSFWLTHQFCSFLLVCESWLSSWAQLLRLLPRPPLPCSHFPQASFYCSDPHHLERPASAVWPSSQAWPCQLQSWDPTGPEPVHRKGKAAHYHTHLSWKNFSALSCQITKSPQTKWYTRRTCSKTSQTTWKAILSPEKSYRKICQPAWKSLSLKRLPDD